MYRETGYKTLTPIQLCNGVAACDAGAITFRALRVYFACFELLAVREAARRSRKKARRRGEASSHYQLSELRRVLGMDDEAAIRRDLGQLRRVRLAFSQATPSRSPRDRCWTRLDFSPRPTVPDRLCGRSRFLGPY